MEAPQAMRRLHVFNPETEMALGAGGASYSPPRAIAALKKRWELLPGVWAASGDYILTTGTTPSQVLKNLLDKKEVKAIDLKAIKGLDATPAPWGWNLALKNELLRYGVPENQMPSAERLRKWRELAHRKTARTFHQLWREAFCECHIELPEICHTDEEALNAAKRFSNACFKLPWSSSGRGVWFNCSLDETKLRTIAHGAIKRQGAIIVEKAEAVALNFASEWECRQGKCHFLGFSLFHTERAGYSGNLSAPQEEITSIIEKSTGKSILEIAERQRVILEQVIASHYEGLFGVDMFATADGRINPCVEINLRRTMGHATLAWWEETERRGLFPALVFIAQGMGLQHWLYVRVCQSRV